MSLSLSPSQERAPGAAADTSSWPTPSLWRPLRLALATIVTTLLIVVGWGVIAKLDSAAVATGTLMVDLNRRVVQHLEGGIVGEVLVRDGDVVTAGQPLLRLDATRARAQLTMIQDDSNRLRAREATLRAERDSLPNPAFPDDLVQREADPKIAEIIETQRNEFQARHISLQGQADILSQRVLQMRKQIDGLRVRIESNDRQLALIRQEVAIVEGLVRQGLERLARLLALQRDEARLLGERGEAIENIARTEQAINETEMQQLQLHRSRQEEIARDLRDVQGRIFELREREVAAADQLSRIDISAPEGGTVMDLRYTAPGGVIAPGAQVASIVPERERLVVEAQLSPTEVDTVRPGMVASIRLSHAGARWTPVIEGIVERISPDRMVDQRTGQPYFIVRVGVPADEMERHGDLKLQSGMHTDVLIRRGERSVVSYLVRPFLDRFSKSLREF
jgi:HlyD family type I secretion membrane fusion protein